MTNTVCEGWEGPRWWREGGLMGSLSGRGPVIPTPSLSPPGISLAQSPHNGVAGVGGVGGSEGHEPCPLSCWGSIREGWSWAKPRIPAVLPDLVTSHLCPHPLIIPPLNNPPAPLFTGRGGANAMPRPMPEPTLMCSPSLLFFPSTYMSLWMGDVVYSMKPHSILVRLRKGRRECARRMGISKVGIWI